MLPLKQSLLARIAEDGPIPFEEFQATALYDPEHGFFSKGQLRSTKAGDFLTSPEVSPLFGETLARFVEKEHERIREGGLPPSAAIISFPPLPPPGGETSFPPPLSGERFGGGGSERNPEPEGVFHLVEAGAGSGSLLRPLLNSLSFSPEVWAVEASPMAREALSAGIVSPEGGRPLNILSSLDDLPDNLTGVILANELIDNLPVAIAVRTENGWSERWVGADGEALVLVDAPARSAVIDWCERFAGPCPVGGYVEVQLVAATWLETAIRKLDCGSLVLIDYGDTAENLEPRRTEGTLRTYRAHHLGPHPLDEPGETDITVDVNFSALRDLATEFGAEVEYHRQDDFLASLGLRRRLSELRRAELDLARDGDAMERLKIRSTKNEVETLLHPRGLGDFRVLVARVGRNAKGVR